MKRILLADDEDILRMLIIDTLEEEDFIVDEAQDGEEALRLIGQHEYDLLILDYMMPVLTGLEVIEQVRKGDRHNLKILMLTAKSQAFEQEHIFKAGADYFMPKPFSPFELLKKVEEIVNED
ncbi:response regulator transcription factor [Niallia sp. 03133]|uniref:response regulator transcription factor n=1 Tax=Niallia sp. 03133 TaxID=3458060 RepID=UPI0040443AFA